MMDLRIVNTSEGINTTLGNNDIEFIDLIEPSMNVEVKTRQVVGRYGTNKSGVQTGDTELELKVRFRGDNPLDYFRKEQMLKQLLSVDSYFTISPMYSYSDNYEFEKIGDTKITSTQMYTAYSWDVMVNGSWEISRSGYSSSVSVPLLTTGIPFRYVGTNVVDLKYPTTVNGNIMTYKFTNSGTMRQDSRLFPMELEIRGVSSTSITLSGNSGWYQVDDNIGSSEVLIYNGYSTKVNGRSITDKTNYGSMVVIGGDNEFRLNIISVNPPTNISGHIIFKEYIK